MKAKELEKKKKKIAQAVLHGTKQGSFSLLLSRDKAEVKIKESEGSEARDEGC